MSRRYHTADELLRLASTGATEVFVAPGDLLTPLARDVASEKGIRVVAHSTQQLRGPRLLHFSGVDTAPLEPFPVDLHHPEMDVRLLDVLTAEHGMPMAAGMMSLRAGSFPWTLNYDEVEYVIEGELHITTADQLAVGLPGDVIAVPKGSSITFGTPSVARFLYVTYPADWGGTP